MRHRCRAGQGRSLYLQSRLEIVEFLREIKLIRLEDIDLFSHGLVLDPASLNHIADRLLAVSDCLLSLFECQGESSGFRWLSDISHFRTFVNVKLSVCQPLISVLRRSVWRGRKTTEIPRTIDTAQAQAASTSK